MFNKKPLNRALLLALGTMTSTYAAAQDNTSDDAKANSQLEVIEVTAQKRVQGFMEVPVAVTTVSGEILDAAQATEFQDLELLPLTHSPV